MKSNGRVVKWLYVFFAVLAVIPVLISCTKKERETEELSKQSVNDISESLQTKAVYPKSTVNIRKGPGTKYPIVRKAKKGEQLPYTGFKNNWYKLKVEDGKPEEWVFKDVVITYVDRFLREQSELALIDWSWRVKSGRAITEGKVRNVSDKDLQHIKAVIVYQTKEDKFIISDSALIKYDPLRPGQTSPFKVETKYNPAMDSARIDFTYLSGEAVEWYEED